jgi:hypothetical protein
MSTFASAVSQAGCVFIYCGCPTIHWVSKLQSEIALSTTEAEYQALSMCLCGLLLMCTLVPELSKGFNFPGVLDLPILGTQSCVNTQTHQLTVFEYNTGCLQLVNKPDQFRPRTKHFGIKCHHFCDAVKNGSVLVKKIDTGIHQLADPLTKPLPQLTFKKLQMLLIGW